MVGKGAVLGKPCEIHQAKTRIGAMKIWTWKNLPLKLHVEPSSDSAPTVDVVATAVQAPAAVSTAQFKLPAGYTVVGPGTGAAGRMGARSGKPGVVPVQ